MKEIIFEDLVKVDLNKNQLNEFFDDPINKQHQKDFKVYEKSGAQGGLFDITQKDKYTKLYKDKNEVLKKVDRTLKNTIVKYSDVTNEIELVFFEEGFLTPSSMSCNRRAKALSLHPVIKNTVKKSMLAQIIFLDFM